MCIFTSLLLSNRGTSESEALWLFLSTKELARDALDVLDDLAKKERSSVYFVGPRMGRMVAQELSLLDSAMVANLTLISTTSHCLKDLGLPKGVNDTKSADARRAESFHMSFAEEWLNVPDEVAPRVFATNADAWPAAWVG